MVAVKNIIGVAVMHGILGCGDNTGGPVPDFEPDCEIVPFTDLDQFSRSTDFPPVVGYTLDGADLDGRWLRTGTVWSSMYIEREGDEVVLYGGIDTESTSSEIFTTFTSSTSDTGEQDRRITWRISNRAADGSLRFDGAWCAHSECEVCSAKMIRIERFDAQESEKVALVGELDFNGFRSLNVRVVGDVAYVIREDGLYTVDITDPAKPVKLGHFRGNPEGYPNDVKLVDAGGRRYALIADAPVAIVDVTDPRTPVLAGQIPVEAHTLFVEGTRAYFGALDGTTPVYDVSDPPRPMRLGAFDTGATYVHDLSVSGGIAYLSAWEKGFYAVDYTDPAQPQLLGRLAKTPARYSHSNWTTVVDGRRIAVHGDETWSAHLSIVDVEPTSPTFMKPIGSYRTRDEVSVHNVMAFGSKAYVTYYQDGVRILDLSNPTQPSLLGYYNTFDPHHPRVEGGFFEGAIGIDVDLTRKLLFIADTTRGLLILRDDT